MRPLSFLYQPAQLLQHFATRVLIRQCPRHHQTACIAQHDSGPGELLDATNGNKAANAALNGPSGQRPGLTLSQPPEPCRLLQNPTRAHGRSRPLSAQTSSTLHMHNAKHVPFRAPIHGHLASERPSTYYHAPCRTAVWRCPFVHLPPWSRRWAPACCCPLDTRGTTSSPDAVGYGPALWARSD